MHNSEENGSLAGMLYHLVAGFETTWAQFIATADLPPGSEPWHAARQVIVHTAPLRAALERGRLDDAGVTAVYHAMQIVLLTSYAQDIANQITPPAKHPGGRPAKHTPDQIGATFTDWRARHADVETWPDGRILTRMKDDDPTLPTARHMRTIIGKLGLLQPSDRNGTDKQRRCQLFFKDDGGVDRQCILPADHLEDHAIEVT